MDTSKCPKCGGAKSRNSSQCQQCANQTRSAKLTGRKYPRGRVERSKDGQRAARENGTYVPFDIAGHMAGKPHPSALPLGTERVVKDGRVVVRTAGGWRYRSRLVWAAAHGPLTPNDIIHHQDEDPMNDDLANLELLTRSEHMKLHATPERMREMQRLSMKARRR